MFPVKQRTEYTFEDILSKNVFLLYSDWQGEKNYIKYFF